MEQNLQMEYLQNVYEKLTLLGENQGLHTWLARSRNTGQVCVWKEVQQSALEVYQRLQGVRHPNLAAVLQAVGTGQGGIVIEEYISGQTLEELLADSGKLPEEQALSYVRQLFSAMAAVEQNGLVHRDIQPKNILISSDGVLKLTDFGIARIIRDDRVKDTQLLGTVGYAAPEQFGFQQTDIRSDIYGAGMVFHAMLTGHPMQGRQCETDFYRDFILHCVEMEPDRRYGSVQEALVALNSTKGKKLRPYAPIGFRSGVLWKEILAGFFYFSLAFMILMNQVVFLTRPTAALLQFVSSVFLYVCSFIALTNCFDWYHRLPPFRKMGEAWRLVMQIVLAVASICVGMVFYDLSWALMGK